MDYGVTLEAILSGLARIPPKTMHGSTRTASLTHKLARHDDLDALRALMNTAIAELQKPFVDERQIASSRTIMGLDTQLIDDGTYFIVAADGKLAGCGGWSRRAMYTHPHQIRKGFRKVELMATMAGEPLYRSCGYEPCERVMDDRGGVAVPLLRMRKSL